MQKINLQLFADEEGATQLEGQPIEKGTESESKESNSLTLEEVQKMIQSETDKIRTDYSKKLKDKDRELEDLQKSKMTEEEKAKFELEKLQNDLSEKEKAIQLRELTIKTVDLLKENDIPLEFRNFLIGQDEESTAEKVRQFKELWSSEIQKSVEERFKTSGRTPHQATSKSSLEQLQEDYANAKSNYERITIQQKIYKLKNEE